MSTAPRQHTPGPWDFVGHDAGGSGYHLVEIGANHPSNTPALALVTAPAGRPDSEAEANARLIAAAPELLAALECILKRYESAGVQCYPEARREVIAARAAIAKATGGAA